MNLYVLILRLFHIVPGIFWVGGAFLLTLYLAPSVRAAGPDGGKVMGHLVLKTGFSRAMSAAAGLTVLAGILLYLHDLGNLGGAAWITAGPGLGFLIGAVFALAGFVFGIMTGNLAKKVALLGGAIAAAGGPPSPEQGAEMAQLQATLGKIGNYNVICLTIAILMMSLSRYLVF
jgi:uncharacterized membrane protein